MHAGVSRVSRGCTSPGDNLAVLFVQELEDEQGTPGPVLLSADLLERVLLSRLSDGPEDYPQAPVPYLLGCYQRCLDEFRQSSSLRDKAAMGRVQDTLVAARALVVSYVGLLLTMEDMFPQVISIHVISIHVTAQWVA